MNLIELINHVGMENIQIQRIDQSLLNVDTKKSGISKLTIETNQFNANDAYGLTCGKPPKMHGLVVWMPTDKLPR